MVSRKRRVSRKEEPSPVRVPRTAVAPFDAEDIALARLQAHLRKTEAIRTPSRQRIAALARTTVQLPRGMLQQVRDRARRQGATVSNLVEKALERYLRSP